MARDPIQTTVSYSYARCPVCGKLGKMMITKMKNTQTGREGKVVYHVERGCTIQHGPY